MGAVQRATTATVEEKQRVSFWNAGSQSIGGVDARPIGTGAFNAEVVARHMGPLIVYGLAYGPHRVVWSRERISQFAEPFLRVRFQRTGSSILEFGGQQICTRAGEWSVVDGSRSHSIVNEEDASTLSLQIPRSQLSEREFETARRMGGPFPTAGGVSHLLYECLRLAIEELDEARDAADQAIGESMCDMFRIIIKEHDHARARTTMRETAESRIRAYIARRLTDADLSVDKIAAAMKCSRRYVHKLFEGGETVSQYIWSQRLERCREQLEDPAAGAKTLTELAFEFGFRSSAHFSRAFRARFGATPSDFRARSGKLAMHGG
jgi:AraC-like DNA-binding protein